jgi:hypothetical protein
MVKFLDLGNGICVNAEAIACVRRAEEPFTVTIHLVNGQKIEAEANDADKINDLLQHIGLPIWERQAKPKPHKATTTRLSYSLPQAESPV